MCSTQGKRLGINATSGEGRDRGSQTGSGRLIMPDARPSLSSRGSAPRLVRAGEIGSLTSEGSLVRTSCAHDQVFSRIPL